MDVAEQSQSTDTHQDVARLHLGHKIRNLRHRRNLTLQGVADLTGLSKSLLSQIENEVTVPPLVTLARISSALGVSLESFFEETRTTRRISFIPADQRLKIAAMPHNRPDRTGYSYQALTRPITNQHMEPFWVELQPRKSHQLEYFNHSGEEFLFVQEGQLEFFGGDQTLLLNAGDSLYFDATIPHAARCAGPAVTKALVVLYADK
jgi:transcriptional regulator with XRE-family HTH domain